MEKPENQQWNNEEIQRIGEWIAEKHIVCRCGNAMKVNVPKSYVPIIDGVHGVPAITLICVDCGRIELLDSILCGVNRATKQL